MLGLVLHFVNLKDLEKTLFAIPPATVVFVVLVYTAGQILSSVKWWMIARSAGIDTSWPMTLKAYFIGMFVNCFGFGTVGGDVARGLLLSDGKKTKTLALATVIADRAQGLAVLTVIGLLSVAIFGQPLLDARLVYLLLALLAAVAGVWFIAPSLILGIFPEHSRPGRILRQVFAAFPRNVSTLFWTTVISVTFHFSQIWLHALMAGGLGVSISWSVLLTTIPFVNILATLPISWNGLGVREKSYIYFLFPAVLSREQAVAVGALWLLSVAITSSIGGIVSVITKDFDIVEEKEQLDLTSEQGVINGGK